MASGGIKLNGLLDRLARTLHAIRLENSVTRAVPVPSLDDSRCVVTMAACALFGEALAGELMLQSAGLGTDPEARSRLRHRLARTMERSVVLSDDPDDVDAG